MKKLIIAEKNSVGQMIAKVVGATQKHTGYLEGDNYIVSWARGHLIQLAKPDAYGYKSWQLSTLPIIPNKWQYTRIEDEETPLKNSNKEKQIDILKSLINRNDVESLVEATDAGREGELIFRLIYYFLGCKKPFERLWISSLEESAIRQGMCNLRPSQDFDNLYAAASCRARADWLFGMNGTRLYSLTKPVIDGATSVGRVQTPTLAMIVKRQEEIDNFKKSEYWICSKTFSSSWKIETEKFENKVQANACYVIVKNKGIDITSVEKITKKQNPPLLYSLSTLQQDCNIKYGMTAAETLKTAQYLYENKLLTYPRTDSNYITTDMVSSVSGIIKKNFRKFEKRF